MNLIQEHGRFIASLISIIIVDLTLRGDNAVVIAAAARSLPRALRKRALVAGAGCAVVALVVATFFATRLLHVRFLQLVGGVTILWIAIGMFKETAPPESTANHLTSFWKAIWFIVVADVTMSLDNVLAIAALAEGSLLLLLFGLGLSIPLVFLASGLLSTWMDRYPVIVYIGAALLGRVAGHMLATDAFIVQTFAPSAGWNYAAEAVGVIGVLVAGWWITRRSRKRIISKAGAEEAR
jgi:YjbE family integral membrane protein